MLSYFGHKFDGKELILRYYRTEPKKFAVAENFYPQKWEVHVPNFRQTMACIPLYTNMASTPLPGLVTSRINARLNVHYCKIFYYRTVNCDSYDTS